MRENLWFEYGLIAAAIAVVIIGMVQTLGTNTEPPAAAPVAVEQNQCLTALDDAFPVLRDRAGYNPTPKGWDENPPAITMTCGGKPYELILQPLGSGH